jgi:hypothetical protein
MIAALYVEKNGCYFGLPGVDPWDEEKDARQYAGPHPVVAHPPCERWCQLSAVNAKRWGFRIDDDEGCFAAALQAVRRFGGVLEHPAESRAFKTYGVPKPRFGVWQQTIHGDWTTEVWQSAYGHRAKKRTWLIYRGLQPPPSLVWTRPPGECQIGWFDRKKPQLPASQRARTPLAFRDCLLAMAGKSRA